MEANGEDEQNFHHCNSPSSRVLCIAKDLVARTRFSKNPVICFEPKMPRNPLTIILDLGLTGPAKWLKVPVEMLETS
jgi:hypothetical protein